MEFDFPCDYPSNLPTVKELDKKIPETFHRNQNLNLCLCAPAEEWLIFTKRPTLENFILNLLNPYLLCWLWYDKFKEMPWGERQHGPTGIIESYRDLLRLDSLDVATAFIKKLAMNNLQRNDTCPCGSGLSYRHCHMLKVQKLTNRLPSGQIIRDIIFGGII